jgi:formylglycine-generating enzyme required for sulfatase activity
MERNITVFISYAHKDEDLREELEKHLCLLKRQYFINVWHDRDISAGTDWKRAISTQLNTAQIILLLISPDFMASEYCYSDEMKQAIGRHQAKEARVIPIILRHVDWEEDPLFGHLQALPTGGAPIESDRWRYRDEAFLDVVKGLRKVLLEEWQKESPVQQITPMLPMPPTHLVTNREYYRFVQSGGRIPLHWKTTGFPDSLADTPVTWVSWDDAVAYCDWAGGCLPGPSGIACTENAGAAHGDAAEIAEWRDGGTDELKQVCDPQTSRVIALHNPTEPLPNVGFRCESVSPLFYPNWVVIGGGSCRIGTDIDAFSLLATTYDLPSHLRQPILRRPASLCNVRSFTMLATCVTNEEFLVFTSNSGKKWPSHWNSKWLKATGRPFPARLASLPVVNVSAEDAEAYCSWSQTRLPTSVEWECAVAGPLGYPYPWGVDYSTACCNSVESGRGSLVPVNTYPLGDSPEGVRQLCGNVAEWVLEPGRKYEIRGGSYRMSCELWGLAYAFRQPEIGFRAPDVGFRVVIN